VLISKDLPLIAYSSPPVAVGKVGGLTIAMRCEGSPGIFNQQVTVTSDSAAGFDFWFLDRDESSASTAAATPHVGGLPLTAGTATQVPNFGSPDQGGLTYDTTAHHRSGDFVYTPASGPAWSVHLATYIDGSVCLARGVAVPTG
jgi:hypothetical protein